MKRVASQITVAIVCGLLGFMLTYQFRLLSGEEKDLNSKGSYNKGSEISSELEQLQKQKVDIEKQNSELNTQLKKYESNATDQGEITKEISKQLEITRKLLGKYELQGPGIILSLTPQNTTVSSNGSNNYIKDEQLIYLINELNFAGAEAVSINNKRITSQSGIKSSNNNSYILINDEKIFPTSIIIIRAIGDKVKLESSLKFPGVLDSFALVAYKSEIQPTDLIVISKYDSSYRFDFLKPVNK